MGFLSKLTKKLLNPTNIITGGVDAAVTPTEEEGLFKASERISESSGLTQALNDSGSQASPGSLTSIADPGDLTGTKAGSDAREASRLAEEAQLASLSEAGQEFRRATGEAQGFLEPFAGVGRQGLDLAGFLTDPSQQQDFLQNNPLFQLGLQNLNEQTNQTAAARGRLSAGDTLEQLQQNATIAGQPLIQQQKQSIVDLLNFGSGTSRAQANAAIGEGSQVGSLIQDRGNVEASGIAGRNQISQDQQANNQQLALTIGKLFAGGA